MPTALPSAQVGTGTRIKKNEDYKKKLEGFAVRTDTRIKRKT